MTVFMLMLTVLIAWRAVRMVVMVVMSAYAVHDWHKQRRRRTSDDHNNTAKKSQVKSLNLLAK